MSARRLKSGLTRQPWSRSASAGSSAAWDDGIEDRFRHELKKRNPMGKGILLWLVGIPIPIILLLWIFGYLH
jgi:hypothetical protein